MNVIIKSDGTSTRTTVEAEDGTPIRGVTAIYLNIETQQLPLARVEVYVHRLEVKARARVFAADPDTGRPVEIAGFVMPDGSIKRFCKGGLKR